MNVSTESQQECDILEHVGCCVQAWEWAKIKKILMVMKDLPDSFEALVNLERISKVPESSARYVYIWQAAKATCSTKVHTLMHLPQLFQNCVFTECRGNILYPSVTDIFKLETIV